MKLFSSLMLLVCAPLALAADGGGYPKERVAQFVVEKLDVTTLPSALRPKHEKGKKTFGDYGFLTQKAEDKESLVESPNGGPRYSLKVLQQSHSGIFVCFAQQSTDENAATLQRVLFVKRKNGGNLLKGRESSREFDGCPAIGGAAADTDSESLYGG
jgi:hypothetical protein